MCHLSDTKPGLVQPTRRKESKRKKETEKNSPVQLALEKEREKKEREIKTGWPKQKGGLAQAKRRRQNDHVRLT